MAQPTTLPFADFVVQLGNGATPEVFSAPCGFIKTSLKHNSQSSDTVVPDCDDPGAPSFTQAAVYGLSIEVSGSGVLAMESVPTWRNWWLSGADKNVRIIFNLPGANNGGFYSCAALLTEFTADVDLKSEGARTQIAVTIKSDGAVTWTPNA